MTIYELTNRGYEKVDDYFSLIDFYEGDVYYSTKNEVELRLEYNLKNIPFDINGSYFTILLQDIYNNISCGTLFVSLPVGEDFDTIIYTIRFSEKEFEKIKKFT